jgi:hypothetical protein
MPARGDADEGIRQGYEFSRLKKSEAFTVIPAVFKRESICRPLWMPD